MWGGEVKRVAVSPKTCTVLGYQVKPTDLRWTGLDLSRAEPRVQSSLMLALTGPEEAYFDLHLTVPWEHPDDKKAGIDSETFYRVRPRIQVGKRWEGRVVKFVAFERWDGVWTIAYEVAVSKK